MKTFLFCSSPDFRRKIGRSLSEDLFFFCSSPDFWAKSRTKFECGNFNCRTMSLSNFLKFLPPFSKSCVGYWKTVMQSPIAPMNSKAHLKLTKLRKNGENGKRIWPLVTKKCFKFKKKNKKTLKSAFLGLKYV